MDVFDKHNLLTMGLSEILTLRGELERQSKIRLAFVKDSGVHVPVSLMISEVDAAITCYIKSLLL